MVATRLFDAVGLITDAVGGVAIDAAAGFFIVLTVRGPMLHGTRIRLRL